MEARDHAAIGLAAQRGAHGAQLPPRPAARRAHLLVGILRAVPQLDVVYVPIGQGLGMRACGHARSWHCSTPCAWRGQRHATTYADSLAAGRVVEAPSPRQLADGMACRVAADPEALAVLAPHIDHIVQASDAEVAAAMRAMFTDTHNVAERGRCSTGGRTARARVAPTKTRHGVDWGNVDASVFAQTGASQSRRAGNKRDHSPGLMATVIAAVRQVNCTLAGGIASLCMRCCSLT